MCGRFLQLSALDDIARLLGAEEVQAPDSPPRYNVAPMQAVAALRIEDTRRTLVSLRWGLIPPWATVAKIAHALINARAETVAEKPAFRTAFRTRRCLIPADGFYEWMSSGSTHKQPYCFRMRDRRPFAFAGLWERWSRESVETCAIVTTEANVLVAPVHHRMPVIVPKEHFGTWLDQATPAAALHGLLRPYPAVEMIGCAVGQYVNNPRNEGPACLAS